MVYCCVHAAHLPYNLGPPCAFLRIGSILVAFMTSPLTFSFPLMKSFCAFAFPVTSLPKLSSLSDNVTEAFFGGAPLPTAPVSFKSTYHDSVAPEAFLSSKAKIALPCLMAAWRPASSFLSDEAMASKAADEGKASGA